MEPKTSLSCSQEPTTSPYLEPDESSPHPHTLFLEELLLLLLLSSHIHLGFLNGFILPYPTPLILLDLMTLMK